VIALYGENLTKLWASSETILGNKLRPWSVRFSTTRSSESSVYSMRGIGTYPTYHYKLRIKAQVKRGGRTCSISWGTITLLISFQRCGLNFKLPSLSNKRSRVRRAQSSPNRLLSYKKRGSLDSGQSRRNTIYRVFAHSAEPASNTAKQIVKVRAVLVIVECSPRFA